MTNLKITGYKVIADYGVYQQEVILADTVAQAFNYLKECQELGAEYITIKMKTVSKKFLFVKKYNEIVVHEWSNEEE
jgi:hypothetical protein